jgi:hypothetical protein
MEECLEVCSNVRFENPSPIYLERVDHLEEDVVFNNYGSIHLNSLRIIPRSVRFLGYSSPIIPNIISRDFRTWDSEF